MPAGPRFLSEERSYNIRRNPFNGTLFASVRSKFAHIKNGNGKLFFRLGVAREEHFIDKSCITRIFSNKNSNFVTFHTQQHVLSAHDNYKVWFQAVSFELYFDLGFDSIGSSVVIFARIAVDNFSYVEVLVILPTQSFWKDSGRTAVFHNIRYSASPIHVLLKSLGDFTEVSRNVFKRMWSVSTIFSNVSKSFLKYEMVFWAHVGGANCLLNFCFNFHVDWLTK